MRKEREVKPIRKVDRNVLKEKPVGKSIDGNKDEIKNY